LAGRFLSERNPPCPHQVWSFVDNDESGVRGFHRVVVGVGDFARDERAVDGEIAGSLHSADRHRRPGLGISCALRYLAKKERTIGVTTRSRTDRVAKAVSKDAAASGPVFDPFANITRWIYPVRCQYFAGDVLLRPLVRRRPGPTVARQVGRDDAHSWRRIGQQVPILPVVLRSAV
jgi:hypothetical protein